MILINWTFNDVIVFFKYFLNIKRHQLHTTKNNIFKNFKIKNSKMTWNDPQTILLIHERKSRNDEYWDLPVKMVNGPSGPSRS